jgi:hypothetical protein
MLQKAYDINVINMHSFKTVSQYILKDVLPFGNQHQRLKGILFFVIVSFFYFILSYSINIPIDDDYGQQFLVIEMAKSGDWLDAFFHAHNEHRPFTTYLFPLLSWLIFGWVNMKVTIFAGTALLILLLLFFQSFYVAKKITPLTLCLALLLLTPSGRDFVWAGGALQYYAVLLFGFISIWLLQFPSWMALIGSILSYFLASFSMASGLLTCIPALLYLLSRKKSAPTKHLIFYSLASILFWYLHQSGKMGASKMESFIVILNNPVFVIKYILLLTGNFLSDFFSADQIILLAAFFHIAFLRILFLSRKNITRNDPLWFFLLYISLTCAAVLVGRIKFFSLEQALSDRYQIYSACYWSVALIILAKHNLISLKIQHTILGFLLFIFGSSFYKQTTQVGQYLANIEKNHELYLVSGDPTLLAFPDPSFADKSMRKAMEGGYYQIPKKITDRIVALEKNNQIFDNQKYNYFEMFKYDVFRNQHTPHIKGNCIGFLDAINANSPKNSPNYILAKGWVSPNPHNGTLCDSVFLKIEIPGQDTLYRKADRYYRQDVALHFSRRKMAKSGFIAIADLHQYSGTSHIKPICFTEGKYFTTDDGGKTMVNLKSR